MNVLYKRIITIGMISFTAGLAWLYCVLEYRSQPVYIVVVSLILILSLYALLNASVGLKLEKRQQLQNYIQETITSNITQLKTNSDTVELERLTKALYVQIRKINTVLTNMAENSQNQMVQSLETTGQLIEGMTRVLADSVNKSTKIVVKYNQNNNDRLLSSFDSLSTELKAVNAMLEQMKSEIGNVKFNVSAPQLTETNVPANIAVTQTIPEAEAEIDEIEATTETEPQIDEIEATAETEPQIDEIEAATEPEPQIDEREPAAAPSADANRQLSADEIAALFAANSNDSVSTDDIVSVAEPEPQADEIEAATEPEPQVAEPEPAAAPSADANRQLSADEIAALFAANSNDSPSSSEAKPIPEPEAIVEQAPASAAPVSADANRQLSPEEIAALFSSVQ